MAKELRKSTGHERNFKIAYACWAWWNISLISALVMNAQIDLWVLAQPCETLSEQTDRQTDKEASNLRHSKSKLTQAARSGAKVEKFRGYSLHVSNAVFGMIFSRMELAFIPTSHKLGTRTALNSLFSAWNKGCVALEKKKCIHFLPFLIKASVTKISPQVFLSAKNKMRGPILGIFKRSFPRHSP